MPWKDATQMDLRREFCQLAQRPEANVADLCRRYGISRTTGYRWMARFRDGDRVLADRSHRPHRSPGRTSPEVEERIVALRLEQPSWGARKLGQRLRDLGEPAVPGAKTITTVLHRHDLIDPAVSATHLPLTRFEAPAPNELWQLDFTGWFALARGRCHPLPVLDDHSRFLLGLGACANEEGATVEAHLTALFRRYGLPWRLLCDNGPPWGTTQSPHRLTTLAVWLLRLGIEVVHGRPYHPQTQGKLERLNRTLEGDVIRGRRFTDLDEAQTAFDRWRQTDNQERPHDALGLRTPLSRYAPSPRPFPETLPPLVYDAGDLVRRVDAAGRIGWAGRRWAISDALAGQDVGLRPTLVDGVVEVRFARMLVRALDRRAP